jgi:hypothetical protein
MISQDSLLQPLVSKFPFLGYVPVTPTSLILLFNLHQSLLINFKLDCIDFASFDKDRSSISL